MKRKIFSILFALVLVLSFSLVTAVPVAADGLVQNIDTGEMFSTIQAAINDPDTLDGHTINVAAGTYDEVGAIPPGLITVNKKNLTLRSTEGAEATIVCAIRIAPGNDGVTIDGFTAEGPWTYGIYVWGAANCVVTNNISRNMTQAGIGLASSNGCTIENNIVEDNYFGIRLSSNSKNCTVKNNVAEYNTCGIELDSSDECMVENNLASNNQYYGIRIVVSNNNTVLNNTVTFNSVDGIRVRGLGMPSCKGSSNNVMEKNNISGNGGWGIYFQYSYCDPSLNNTVKDNCIHNNTGGGLLNENPWITVNATNNWWGDASGPYPTGTGDAVSGSVDFDPWLKSPIPGVCAPPVIPMSKFEIDHAKIDFKKKIDDDKIRVQGKLELDLVNGDGVAISEDVTVTVGPLSETITMVEMGKKGDRWHYQRLKDDEGIIKHMTINWKNGKFDIRIDKADLTGVTNPLTISVQIGDDVGSATILMRVKKHHWDYKAK